MPTRFLLALLSALLAPAALPGEVAAVELSEGMQEPVEWTGELLGWDPERTLSGGHPGGASPGVGRNAPPASPACADHQGHRRLPDTPELATQRSHLARCGHRAARLDLPPPPRD